MLNISKKRPKYTQYLSNIFDVLTRAHAQKFSGARQHDENRKCYIFFMLQQQKTTNKTASATISIFLSWRKTQILSETCCIC